jgi:hypothetical protein
MSPVHRRTLVSSLAGSNLGKKRKNIPTGQRESERPRRYDSFQASFDDDLDIQSVLLPPPTTLLISISFYPSI